MSVSPFQSPSSPDGSIVAHVVVVGFHAQLGNRIEFAYPRLRGDPVLRSPKVTDTTDISSDCSTPTLAHQRHTHSRYPHSTGSTTTTPSKLPADPNPLSPSSSSTTMSSISTTSATIPALSSSSSASSNASSTTGPPSKSTPAKSTPTAPALPLLSPPTTTTTTPSKSPSPPSMYSSPAPYTENATIDKNINIDTQSWGVLPDEWAFLPFMALPDGVHDQTQDVVFFTLPPDVHCVSCFRQIQARVAKTHSASATRGTSYERGVASRGSVQKSVVLLCRRPLFGALADRLVPAVRAYFDQADFANTHVLSSLFHSLNVSLTRPSLATSPDTLFHGLDLRTLVLKLGPQLIAVLKLILLERRVVIYSQPVRHASNAVVALASIFHGALDAAAPSLRPLDTRPADKATGFPLALFGPNDRIILQPYAPLPLLSQLLPSSSRLGCLIGTAHNVGLILSSRAAAHARKTAHAAAAAVETGHQPHHSSDISAENFAKHSDGFSIQKGSQTRESVEAALAAVVRAKQNARDQKSSKQSGSAGAPGGGTVPVVDALVNLATGRVSVSAALEPLCRVTNEERNLMRDLVAAVSRSGDDGPYIHGGGGSGGGVTNGAGTGGAGGMTGPFVGSDDYIRSRLRQYVQRLVQSVSAVDGLLGGPAGGETWSLEMAADFDFSPLQAYNEAFVQQWVTTRNCAQWARKCTRPPARSVVPPPRPEIDPSISFADQAAERVAAGLSGLRRNVADLGRFSSVVSEGLANLFRRIEDEVNRMDTAVGQVNSQQNSPRSPNPNAIGASTRPLSHQSSGFTTHAHSHHAHSQSLPLPSSPASADIVKDNVSVKHDESVPPR